MKTKVLLIMMVVISSLMTNAQTKMNIHRKNGLVFSLPLNIIDSITYTILDPLKLAKISTLPIENIISTSATSGGEIISDGGTPITQRGIVWSTSPNPIISLDTFSLDGSGIGSYSSYLTALSYNTTYYVRAYATNSEGTAYGNELSFTTTTFNGIVTNPGSGVNFDGYTYTSIVLGNGQEWMVENLRTTIYANGDPIPNITDNTQWSSLTSGAWSYYNNDSQYENPYGKMYNWYTVSDSRNVCPTGWHVPKDPEWAVLTYYLGGADKMKIPGTQYWSYSPYWVTNESGFSALPGGYRGQDGTFAQIRNYGMWWSSTEKDTLYAWYRSMSTGDFVSRPNSKKEIGLSVRCLKD